MPSSPIVLRLLPLIAFTVGFAGSALCASLDDPFPSDALYAPLPGGSLDGPLRSPCDPPKTNASLTLTQVVDAALCNNPQTRLAWANARAQAAQVGVAEGAYLPTLAASAGRSHVNSNSATTPTYNQTSAALSASYLLYDFGGRAATLENARQQMSALAATQDATLQGVFLAAVQAYYQLHATQAAVVATRESERAALESSKAADARYRIGTGTPADRLQAQTAASQATLARIQAEGNAQSALGTLANAMGLEAQNAPALAPPPETVPDAAFERNVIALIEQAKQARPDLMAAEAQVKAARAGIDIARANGMPTIALSASQNYNDVSTTTSSRGSTLGVALSIPLFTGFNTTYRVKAAQAQVEAKEALRDQLAKQVSLDVWRAYHALTTSLESVRASADLLASAEASARVAAGRYQAGVGGILDLLNAQSALANARQQNIQSLFNWRIAKTALAQAMGRLDLAQLDASPR